MEAAARRPLRRPEPTFAELFTPKLVDFVSTKVGNYQFSKQFYMLVSQLWVK